MDLTLLNLRVPVVDAVCATVCGDWFGAADLWFEVSRDPRYRGIAAQCGAEAALHAGLLDLAEYFYIGLRDLPDIPEAIQRLREENSAIRQARLKYYQRRLSGWVCDRGPMGGAELMGLRFYRESVRHFLVMPRKDRDPVVVTPLLARAYAMLGAHAALIGLCKSHRELLRQPDVAPMVVRAEGLLIWQAEPPIYNIRRFEQQHVAGPAFTAILEQPAPWVAD